MREWTAVLAAASDPFVLGGSGAVVAAVAALAIRALTRADTQIASVITEKNVIIRDQAQRIDALEKRVDALEREVAAWQARFYQGES